METYLNGQMDAVKKLELQCRVGNLDLTEGTMRLISRRLRMKRASRFAHVAMKRRVDSWGI